MQNVSQLNLYKIAVKVNSRNGLFGIFAAHGVMAISSPGFSRFPICRRHIGKREDPGDEVGGHGLIFGVQPEGSWESFKKAKAPNYRSARHE